MKRLEHRTTWLDLDTLILHPSVGKTTKLQIKLSTNSPRDPVFSFETLNLIRAIEPVDFALIPQYISNAT